MDTKEIIKSQFRAALKMLEGAIVNCPDTLWDHPVHKNKFWHTVFHSLFYTHLYLQPTEGDYTPWAKHESKFISLGDDAPPDDQVNHTREPYRKEEMLEYLELCLEEVSRQVASVDLEAASGFYWLPFNKLELQFYNIRHIQHHTGELYNRLEAREGIELSWVGMQKE
jgi:hypothetical protein